MSKDLVDVAIKRCSDCPFWRHGRCGYYCKKIKQNPYTGKAKYCKVIKLVICMEDK